MLPRITLALSILFLSACASVSSSIPPGYAGAQAQLEDSAVVHGGSKADLFAVEQVNGQAVDNNIRKTETASRGRGFALTTAAFGRPVVASKPIRLAVIGRTVFAAPIQALTSTVYQVKGIVEFIPSPDLTYVVRGVLTDDYSAVWVEESVSKTVVGDKVEVKGSARLGILEK